MFQQHFGLKHMPFSKNSAFLAYDSFTSLKEKFIHLLHSPGIGVLTGEPGVGKRLLFDTLLKN